MENLYEWSTSNQQRLLTYSAALFLSSGDIFRLRAVSADSVLGQQFSAHYVGDTVTGFSVRYTGNYSFSVGESLFANSGAGRTTLYSQGGGYTDNGFTAPVAGAYQVRRPEWRQQGTPLHACNDAW